MIKKRIIEIVLCVAALSALATVGYAETRLLTNFEDSTVAMTTYNGPQSSIALSYVTDVVHEGQQAMLVEISADDWTGAVYALPADRADWTVMTVLSMWVYGQKSDSTFRVVLEEATDLEQFLYPIRDDWDGWKKVIIPLQHFKSRTDWQADTAVVNEVIDYPLKTIHFFTTSGEQGVFKVYFDLLEVSDEALADDAATQDVSAISGPTLRELAAPHQMVVGAAVEPDNLVERAFAERLGGQFNSLTPGNQMKWERIHPGKETYDFRPADQLLEFADAHDMQIRGHTLLWHNQNPGWLTETEWTKEELLAILEDHIRTVVGHYKGRITAWDVINEPFDGGQMRDTFWYRIIGPEYVEKAFMWAHEADPDAMLIINDYNVEPINFKSNIMYTLVKELLDKGVPIHGVGLQGHLVLENAVDFASVYANVKRFADLGLEVHFTEIDIRIKGEPTEAMLAKQAEMYGKLTEICFSIQECSSFTIWGLTDALSWIPGTFKGFGSALLFDKAYQPKPAYFGVREALEAGPQELAYATAPAMTIENRHLIPPFQAHPATTIPVADGVVSDGEWEQGVAYRFAYNQLNSTDQRPPQDRRDLSGDWKVVYAGNTLYGLVTRIDDTTVTSHADVWENDTVEVFVDLNNTFAQLRTVVGGDWLAHNLPGARKAVWSEDGSVLEFEVELPEDDLTGLIIGWNISVSDNDVGEAGRDHQLYPIYGFNDSWEGKNLAELRFVGNTPRTIEKRWLAPPFTAAKAAVAPTIDGNLAPGEWDQGVLYQFAYNQLNSTDQRPPSDGADLSGAWKILYENNVMYGMVTRTDDATVTTHGDVWENDTVEVFGDMDGTFAQLRTVVGQDWDAHDLPGNRKAVWSDDGSVLEFMVELPVENLAGRIMGWNIALADNDAGPDSSRDHQLYPIYGFNDSWEGKNLAEISFQK